MRSAMSVSVEPLPASDIRDKLIIGLDLSSIEEARDLVTRIGDAGTFYKIGYQLAYAGGLDLVRELVAEGKKVFVDLKLHDIGNTVEEGVRSVARLGATFLTVHAYPQTMRAAVAGRAGSSLKILAVTVLTSYDDHDLAEAGYAPGATADLVARRAAQARDIGIDGIVCAAPEAQRMRIVLGRDRKRILTPAEAIRGGADHLVVARPIVQAADPRSATQAIVDEISAAVA
jgi:orotidine-5'-phosphate decarboxylase